MRQIDRLLHEIGDWIATIFADILRLLLKAVPFFWFVSVFVGSILLARSLGLSDSVWTATAWAGFFFALLGFGFRYVWLGKLEKEIAAMVGDATQ